MSRNCRNRLWLSTVLGVILMTGSLAGCGSGAAGDVSTITLEKNGKITEYSVEDFSDSDYDEDELKSFIDSAVETYQGEHGRRSVKEKSLSVNDGTASLTMEYESAETYADFNGMECFAGTVEEAQAAGYDFDEAFYAPSGDEAEGSTDQETGNREVSQAEVLKHSEAKVFLVYGNEAIRVPGTILYVSDNRTEIADDNTVLVTASESGSEEADVLVYVIYE